eukprot:CAMPEP_0171945522 /NCGR_PEP_ID=MMETSP0993-20121228/49132_1 /TAXON_ID=483369 /ORGANISM="non described non described, Strain CCMP2098" /LENGTH=41 /DNA_ID= /DNA_START= /DNA_END= /DNA_ORIENTATION=
MNLAAKAPPRHRWFRRGRGEALGSCPCAKVDLASKAPPRHR